MTNKPLPPSVLSELGQALNEQLHGKLQPGTMLNVTLSPNTYQELSEYLKHQEYAPNAFNEVLSDALAKEDKGVVDPSLIAPSASESMRAGWDLFIDDERYPVKPCVVARTSREAILMVDHWGLPDSIAFDHDLGGEDTVMAFVKWLEYKVTDGKIVIPKHFTFSVHSQNPVGAKNIKSLMDQLLEYYQLD